ncbi:DNA polymerase III subunit delta [Candidatus Neoehrlichia procyonis]|uniref:DNA-directed DNA polymerase n=1 Tax=Candidatus Neoehrlichia procyonis str. RAC413 TaxID=1359163 RepID=A0A0F3NNM9_9RICK|nr:DNA polymerase III subunit delta [Candidatus Neoehrlichia lotoris]KJV69307.1 DNA polymerase III, delta subunit [Candidatus Neoehrlichia lotoris str. RAC413]
MKIVPSKLQNFLRNPKMFCKVLLYGNDNCKINIYTKKIVNHINSNNDYAITKIEFTTINKNPELLLLNLTTIPMFYTKQLLIITNAKEPFNEELKNIINQNNSEQNYIIIIAGELSNPSPLKTYYNNSIDSASIGCYKNDNKNLDYIIKDFLSTNKIEYDNTVIQYIYKYFYNNESEILSQLNKLLLYIGNKKKLTIEDINKSLSTELNPTLESLYISIVEKNIPNFIQITDLLLQSKFTPITLTRVIAKYFMQLEHLSRQVQSGQSVHKAIQEIYPPIFFKLIPTVKKHLTIIKYQNINDILNKLLEIEIQCKKSESIQKTIFKYYMTTIINSTVISKN